MVPLTSGCAAVLERAARTATFAGAGPGDPRVIHPFLAAVGATFARWDGRDALHGGAVVIDGGAWAVLAARNGGKTSLLARLAAAGHGVLADDLLVVDEGRVFAGPRCLDLRRDAAERLGVRGSGTLVREDDRTRIATGPVPAVVPLRGAVVLEWGEPALTPVAPRDRLALLAGHRTILRPLPDPALVVALAAVPVWRLARHRAWASLDDDAQRLVALARRG